MWGCPKIFLKTERVMTHDTGIIFNCVEIKLTPWVEANLYCQNKAQKLGVNLIKIMCFTMLKAELLSWQISQ